MSERELKAGQRYIDPATGVDMVVLSDEQRTAEQLRIAVRDVDGARGSFQDRFLIHLRAGEPCVRCGTTVRKIVVGGRGTYVCEHCQIRPRRRKSQ